MDANGWRECIRTADDEGLTLLAQTLAELDQAKQLLRDAGFGVTGTPLIEMVREIIQHTQHTRKTR